MAARLKQAMEARKMAVPALVKATGLSRAAIYFLLDGTTSAEKVRETTVTKLCKALGVRRDWLLTGRGPMDSGHASSSVNEPSNLSDTSQTGRLDAFNVAVTARALQAFLARRGVTFDITRPEHAELFCAVYAEAVAMPDDDPAAMAALGAVVADLVEHRGKREKARAEVDQAAGGAGVRRGRRVSGA